MPNYIKLYSTLANNHLRSDNNGVVTNFQSTGDKMSAVYDYDRYDYIKDLTDAGLNEPQAEAIAKGALRVHQGVLATKEDMTRLETNIAKLGADNRLLRWMIGFNLALTSAGIIALIIK